MFLNVYKCILMGTDPLVYQEKVCISFVGSINVKNIDCGSMYIDLQVP